MILSMKLAVADQHEISIIMYLQKEKQKEKMKNKILTLFYLADLVELAL